MTASSWRSHLAIRRWDGTAVERRRPGRPPISPEKRRTVVAKTYLTERENECLMTLARQNRQDVSDYLRHLLHRSIYHSLRSAAPKCPPEPI